MRLVGCFCFIYLRTPPTHYYLEYGGQHAYFGTNRYIASDIMFNFVGIIQLS